MAISSAVLGRGVIGRHAIAGDYMPAVVVAAPEPPAYPGHILSIDLCVDWVRVAEAPACVFDGVVRNLAAGEWRLSGSVAALVFDHAWKLTDVNTIRIVRDVDIMFSGYVDTVESGVGGLEVTEDVQGERFVLTGTDVWSVLASRVAYPSPLTGPPWAAPWDIRTGIASTAAAGYITANTGGGTTVDRQIPGLSVIDGLVGLSGAWSARLQPLDQLVARVCKDGRIVCRLRVDYAGAVTARLVAPYDRRASVIISDQGGLTKIQRLRIPLSASFVIAGGQGNLTARTFATAGTTTGKNRREVFSDQSSLSTLTEVQQAANTKLIGSQATLTVKAEVTDAAAAKLQYLVDYDVGDTVTIEIDDTRYPVVVESVTVHIEPGRSVIRPILGDAAPDLVTGLLRDVADLQSRFDTQIS